MILLGAGASIEAGIPGAYGMTEKIAELFRGSENNRVISRVLAFVIGGLLFKRGMDGEDALTSGVNVEELFNAVQLLAERGRLESAPFVGSWHAVVEELDQIDPPEASLSKICRAIQKGVAEQVKAAAPSHVSGLGGAEIDRNLLKAVKAMVQGRSVPDGFFDRLSSAIGKYIEDYIKRWTDNLRNTTPHNSELEDELSKLADQRPKPGQGRVFEFVAEQMIHTLIDIVWINEPGRVKYLSPLFSLAMKQKRIVIASLNYDNAVELAAASAGVSCDSGISEWSKRGKFSFPSEGIALLKLHGSIEWEQVWRPSDLEVIEHLAVHPVDLSNKRRVGYRPAVIFGHRNKLTAEGPFLDLMHAFVHELEDSDLLSIIGYSFGDLHINALLTRWMNGNPQRCMRIVNPYFDQIRSKFKDGLQRIDPARVEVIQEEAGSALTKLYGEYQREKSDVAEMQSPSYTGNPSDSDLSASHGKEPEQID
jgi:hypothetical protein